MLALALGVALAVAVAFGPLGFLSNATDAAIARLIDGTGHALDGALGWLASFVDAPVIFEITALVLAVLTPGVVAGLLALAATASVKLRRGLTAVVAGIVLVAAFTTIDQGGLILVAVAVPLLAVLWFVERIATTAAVALSVLVLLRWVRQLIDPTRPELAAPAQRLAELSGFHQPRLIAGALALAAIGCAVSVAARLLRSN